MPPAPACIPANETDRVGEGKEGTVSAFAIDRADGQLTLLNTVPSGGAGPTYVSVHPSGRFLLVANYFGGSVAVLPILPDGRLGAATDVKQDAGTIGPTKATNAPPGSFAFSGHDRTHAHMIQADPSGRFVLHVDLGLDRIFVWKFDDRSGRADAERSARRLAAAGRRTAALPLPPQRPLVLLHPGGRLDHRAVRLRRRDGAADRAADDLQPAARIRRQQLLLGDPGLRAMAGSSMPATACTTASAIFSVGATGELTYRRRGMDARQLSRAASTSTPPAGSSTAATSAPTTSPSSAWIAQTGRPRLHRPLHAGRQSVDHRLPRPGQSRIAPRKRVVP